MVEREREKLWMEEREGGGEREGRKRVKEEREGMYRRNRVDGW